MTGLHCIAANCVLPQQVFVCVLWNLFMISDVYSNDCCLVSYQIAMDYRAAYCFHGKTKFDKK